MRARTVTACPRPRTRRELRPEIQGLRAVAVALVVVHHLWPSAAPRWLRRRRRLLRDLGLPDHRAPAARDRASRPRPARRLLGAARAADPARGAARARLRAGGHRPARAGDVLAAVRRRGPRERRSTARTGTSRRRPSTTSPPRTARRRSGTSGRSRPRSSSTSPGRVLLAIAALARSRAPRRARARDGRAARLASLAYSLYLHGRRAGRRRTSSRPTRAWEFGLGAPARARRRGRAARRLLVARARGDRRGRRALLARDAVPGRRRAPARRCGALAVIAGRAPGRVARRPPRRSGSATSPTPSTSGTGRCSCSSRSPSATVSTPSPLVVLALTLLAAWAHQARSSRTRCASGAAPRPALAVAVGRVGAAADRVLGRLGLSRAPDRRPPSGPPRRCSPRARAASARPPATRGSPCENPRLRLAGRADAAAGPRPAQCAVHARRARAACSTCAPSARAEAQATATIALVGDSHASHWRAAVDPLAERRGWRGLSITHSGCPFTLAVKDLRGARPLGLPGVEPPDARAGCAATARCGPCSSRRSRARTWIARGRERVGDRGRRLPAGLPRAAVLGADRDRAARHAEGAARDRRLRRSGRSPPAAAPRPRARCRARARVVADPVAAAAAPLPHRPRPARRPHPLHLRRAPLLPGRRRRARPQGRAPHDDGLRALAVALPRPPRRAARQVRRPLVGAASTSGASRSHPVTDGRAEPLRAEGRSMPRTALPIAPRRTVLAGRSRLRLRPRRAGLLGVRRPHAGPDRPPLERRRRRLQRLQRGRPRGRAAHLRRRRRAATRAPRATTAGRAGWSTCSCPRRRSCEHPPGHEDTVARARLRELGRRLRGPPAPRRRLRGDRRAALRVARPPRARPHRTRRRRRSRDRIHRTALGSFWRWPAIRLNQINWYALVYAANATVTGSPRLLRHDLRLQIERFVARARGTGAAAGNLGAGLHFNYLPHVRASARRTPTRPSTRTSPPPSRASTRRRAAPGWRPRRPPPGGCCASG